MTSLRAEEIFVEIDGQTIIDRVILAVQPGEFVGLVGPNGSGKSSLLRTIYRVLKPSAGRVFLDDDDVWTLSPRDTARRVAVVGQERMGEFDFTVTELVAMGRSPHKGLFDTDKAEDRQIVDECLGLVDMRGKASRQFMNLSGGEKQRVLVARALAQRPRFLVLDEPTNHLDIRHQLELLILVRKLAITTLAALHDLNLAARYCDRLIMIHEGKIVAEGYPKDVLTSERISSVYGVGADIRLGEDGVPDISFRPLGE